MLMNNLEYLKRWSNVSLYEAVRFMKFNFQVLSVSEGFIFTVRLVS